MVFLSIFVCFSYIVSINAADSMPITVLVEKMANGKYIPSHFERVTVKPYHTVSQLCTVLTNKLGIGELVLHHGDSLPDVIKDIATLPYDNSEKYETPLSPDHSAKNMQELHDTYGNGTGNISGLGFVFKKR